MMDLTLVKCLLNEFNGKMNVVSSVQLTEILRVSCVLIRQSAIIHIDILSKGFISEELQLHDLGLQRAFRFP